MKLVTRYRIQLITLYTLCLVPMLLITLILLILRAIQIVTEATINRLLIFMHWFVRREELIGDRIEWFSKKGRH